MHRKRAKETVRFGDVRNSFVLSSGANYEPEFSMTDAPENWWRTSRFATSGRFRVVNKDKLTYPRVGQYEPPPSTVQLGSPSITRPSFMPRRPRVTAPATGATAEARKWGADKWLEEPEPGPGHYDGHGSTMDSGEKGCTSYFMRSKDPRFKNDRDHSFLKVRHTLPSAAQRRAKIKKFDLQASLRRPNPGRRRRPQTSVARPRNPPGRRPRTAGIPPRSAAGQFGEVGGGDAWMTGEVWPPGQTLGTMALRSYGAQALDDHAARSVAMLMSAPQVRHKPTPAERRRAFDAAEELRRVEELDVFSYRMMGKHHKVQKMLERKKAAEDAKASRG